MCREEAVCAFRKAGQKGMGIEVEREIDLQEVSDGKLYDADDLVKVGCNDCEGCSECCRKMGNTILLDPWDMYHLTQGLHSSFERLLEKGLIELNMADGAILPNLKLDGKGGGCPFLTAKGRCEIHSFRPGLCRLFPLGRVYENHSFRYFLQIHECSRQRRTKMKVKKWLGIPDLKSYERFTLDWHDYLKEIREEVKNTRDDARRKELTMDVLRTFYLSAWEPGRTDSRTDRVQGRTSPDSDGGFYEQFYARLRRETGESI